MNTGEPMYQPTGTRVELSSGNAFWLAGLSPERARTFLGQSGWKTMPSGRVVHVSQVTQLSYGPIPSTETYEVLEED